MGYPVELSDSQIALLETNRDKIADLQAIVEKMPQVDYEPTHHFTEGTYARELLIKKGTVIIGKIHKHAHFNVILKGHCTVTSPYGRETIVAPAFFESRPDTKRAIYAHEDTIWMTIHPTEKTDPEEIVEDIILSDYSDRLEKLIHKEDL
tara:strand:- start:686 stop:1135 length:450 start_codon:yes stop_codon:yes gene_type:complete